jgi:DNA-binding CsgD family transcriptional regulator
MSLPGQCVASQIKTDEIYEALSDDDAFARLPDLIAKVAKARSSMIIWNDQFGSSMMAFNYFTAEFIQDYIAGWTQEDPWLAAAARHAPRNTILLCEKYVPQSAFENSVIFNEFIRRLQGDDTFHCGGALFESAWGNGIFSFHRGQKAEAFDEDDAKSLREILPHLGRVMRARGELQAHKRQLRFSKEALDTIGTITITVRSDGRILHSNRAADLLLANADCLASANGCLTAKPQTNATALQRAILRATSPSHPVASSAVIERDEKLPYFLTITPLVGHKPAAALVLFRNPYAENPFAVTHLRSLFNLSATEALLALDISRGLSVADIALRRSVQASTVRKQLKVVAAKTGCSRQAEIAALVSGLPQIIK